MDGKWKLTFIFWFCLPLLLLLNSFMPTDCTCTWFSQIRKLLQNTSRTNPKCFYTRISVSFRLIKPSSDTNFLCFDFIFWTASSWTKSSAMQRVLRNFTKIQYAFKYRFYWYTLSPSSPLQMPNEQRSLWYFSKRRLSWMVTWSKTWSNQYLGTVGFPW